MLVSWGMPTVASYTQTAGTLLSANYAALTDLMPAVATRFQMPASSGTPFQFVANLLTSIPVTWPYVVVGLQNCTLPVGTTINLFSNNCWAYTSTGVLTAQPPGKVGYWGVLRQDNTHGSTAATSFTVNIPTGALTNTQFSIGEIWIAPAVNIPIVEFGDKPSDPSWLNRAAGNQAWPGMRNPFRDGTWLTKPIPYADVYGTPSAQYPVNLETVWFQLAQQRAAVVVPRWRQPGNGIIVPDTSFVNQSARLVRVPPEGLSEWRAVAQQLAMCRSTLRAVELL